MQEDLGATLARKRPDRVYARRLEGAQEAHTIVLAASVPPDGREHWSLRLLADELVRLEVVETISRETVRRRSKQRSQTVAERAVVPGTHGGSGVRVAHGRCAGRLRTSLRSGAPGARS